MSAGQRLPGTPDPMHFWNGERGLRIAGDSWGDPTGPLVLLQHGGGQTLHAWKGAGEKLGAAGYYAIAFDARGHGDTDWSPDGDYGQDVMVKDLVRMTFRRMSAALAVQINDFGFFLCTLTHS